MSHNETNPPVRFQKHGKRKGRVTCIIGERKAGKGRMRNRIHRGDFAQSTVHPSTLVPQWMKDAALQSLNQVEDAMSRGRVGLLGIRISA